MAISNVGFVSITLRYSATNVVVMDVLVLKETLNVPIWSIVA